MDWFIAIVTSVNLGLTIAIYRRQGQTSNEAAILEAAAQINQVSQRLAGADERVRQTTEAAAKIEPGGPNDQPTN